MANFNSSLVKHANFYMFDMWQDTSSLPMINDLPLVGCPWPILTIVVAWYIFVTRIGPKFMSRREPYDLRLVMFVHNAMLVVANLYMFTTLIVPSQYSLVTWQCLTLGDLELSDINAMAMSGHFYYISKFIDLLDTVFMVLRKKWQHITPLHLFHHALMPFVIYFGLKYQLHTPSVLVPQLNSFVHIVMYYYFANMAIGNKTVISWKKYLTQLQIAQFSVGFVHALYFTFIVQDCEWPMFWRLVEMVNASAFIALFSLFYYRNYVKAKEL